MSKYHAGRGRKYELLACVSVIQREGCVRANEYRKYELLACVSIIQSEGCMHANEYCKYERKYELLACVSIMMHEGASTSCWHVSASYSTRTQERAAGMCQHHTAREMHALTSTASTSCCHVSALYSAMVACALTSTSKSELLACVSIMQYEGAIMSCWHVLSSYSARAACARTCTTSTSSSTSWWHV